MERSAAKPIAQYLLAVRPILAHAIAGRQAWVRSIGVLMEDARKGHRMVVQRDAVRIGRERLVQFEECRERLARLWPPPSCMPCQRAAISWLDQLIAVCQLLADVGRCGDLTELCQVDDMLQESRAHAREFNAEYARLSEELRRLVAAARVGTRPAAIRGLRAALAS